jgi:cardiolipin synthase
MWWTTFVITNWIIRVVMLLVILRKRMMPVKGLAWLVLIMAFPIPGLVIYVLVGNRSMGWQRARLRQKIIGHAQTEHRMAELRAHQARPPIAPAQRNMIIQAERISGNHIVGGNDVELLPNANEKVARMVADIDAAKHHVHMVYYIFRPDETGNQVIEALKRAARRGVKCRVLADAAGSRSLFKRKGPARDMREAGVEIYPALPVALIRRKLARLDLRNHRKITIVDGRLAYTGSHNLVIEDYGHSWAGKWEDLSGRFTGPVTAQLQMTFLEDWYFETAQHLDGDDLFPPLNPTGEIAAQAVPTGPSHEAETFRRVVIAALDAAQEQIIMTTPYLVPDEPTMLALSMAADRGVEVKIVVPRRSDHPIVSAAGRSYYEPLLEAGVQIYRYHSGMLHAKTITVDYAFALLGSSNLDIRSFYLNFEINLLLYGPEITNHLRFAQNRYIAESDEVFLHSWRLRPASKQYIENACALLSPLL